MTGRVNWAQQLLRLSKTAATFTRAGTDGGCYHGC
jgi:hypothetical protein